MEKQTVGVPAGQTEARACGCEWTAVGHCLRWVGGEWRPSGEFRPCFRREHKQKAGGARAEAASFSVEGRAAPFRSLGQAPFIHDSLPSAEAAAVCSASSFSD